MATGIISLLVSLAGIASVLMNAYMAAAPERKEAKADEQVEKLRAAIAAGDVRTVDDALDHIMRHSAPGDIGVVQNGEAPKGGSGAESGVAGLGSSVDDFVGEGKSV